MLELVERTFSLCLIESRCRTKIQAQLYLRVTGIDALAAGTRRMRKLFNQLCCWYGQPVRGAWPSRYVQIVHNYQCGIACVAMISRP